MHNLRYITEKHFIHLDFMDFWYESELLTYQHSVIFRGGFMLWLELIWGRGKLEWSYAPVWEDIHPYQIAMCCFLYLAVPPRPALALKGNYISILENYKISRATSQRGTQTPASTVLMRLFHSAHWTNIAACRTPGSMAWGEFPIFWRAITTSEKLSSLPL